MSLAGLGLTHFEEQVYRAMLRGEMDTVEAEQDVLRSAVARLAELELVRIEGERVVAVAADVAIPRLIRFRMQEANAELRRISAAWETVHALTTEGRPPHSYDAMERIEDADEVNERIWSLSLNAREALSVHHNQRKIRPGQLPRYLDRLGDGVVWRTILPRRHLEDQAVAEYCRQLHKGGDLHRVTDESVQQMVILDRTVAFVPIVPNGHRSGALMIRQEGAVATLVDLFERVWTHASDLDSPESSPLDDRERQVLNLLSTVAKDEISARKMGVSLRTYRRYVAKLLTRLGADNRVQAAVLAKDQGWI